MSFQFTCDGTVYQVHTEVGEGPARVVIDEQRPAAPDMEASEENANG